MTSTRPVFAHCYWCNRSMPDMPEHRGRQKDGAPARRVVFCSQRGCFQKYLASNRPLLAVSTIPHFDVMKRLEEHLTELKTQSLFLPDTSPVKMVKEEIIFELTAILEGRERVTIHERSASVGVVQCRR